MVYMSRSNDASDVNPLDLLNPFSPRTPEELAASRLEICKGCEWFRKNTQTCKKCGCFMKLKTTLEKAKCPIGKW
jgi:uncharacterized paraquat-inducible protein A